MVNVYYSLSAAMEMLLCQLYADGSCWKLFSWYSYGLGRWGHFLAGALTDFCYHAQNDGIFCFYTFLSGLKTLGAILSCLSLMLE